MPSKSSKGFWLSSFHCPSLSASRFVCQSLSRVRLFQLSSVQPLSHVWLFATPWTAAHQASLSITSSQSPPKPMSIELVMPSNHLILYRPLLLPSIFPSITVFSNVPVLPIRWPKYWSFSFNISPSKEQPGLISFRMDWLDLFAIQGTLESLLQHHSSKASILLCSAFFIVQLSHPYMTTGKTIALTRLFATLLTVVHQASLSMGFPRQEYWSGWPFPSPRDLPDSGIEPRSPAL